MIAWDAQPLNGGARGGGIVFRRGSSSVMRELVPGCLVLDDDIYHRRTVPIDRTVTIRPQQTRSTCSNSACSQSTSHHLLLLRQNTLLLTRVGNDSRSNIDDPPALLAGNLTACSSSRRLVQDHIFPTLRAPFLLAFSCIIYSLYLYRLRFSLLLSDINACRAWSWIEPRH